MKENLTRTDMYCTECGKNFIGELDYSLNGNHIIECPICGHEHCRVIENGKITSDRWDTKKQRINVKTRQVWSNGVLKAKTSSASMFIRERWLNLGRQGVL